MVVGCGREKAPSVDELLIGTWNQDSNKSHLILMIKAQGGWSAAVKIEGVSSRMIERRGEASGTWQAVDNQLTITVEESNVDELWGKGETVFFDILELTSDLMRLGYEGGKVQTWIRAGSPGKTKEPSEVSRVIKVAPLVVNLNKHRSHDRDRYLCLDIELNLKPWVPGASRSVPVFHPRAREATILFLSSLVYGEVSTLDAVKEVSQNLEVMLAPYLDNQLESIKINHVVITSKMDKVDQFLLEHAPKFQGAPQGTSREISIDHDQDQEK